MCIAILNDGKKLTRQELSNCWVSNDDGAGLLYIENGTLTAFKQPNHDGFNVAGADFDKFTKEYDRVYKLSRESNTPVLLHFRIATHGLDPMYLHPFFISDKVGLIHNGIIYGYGSRDFSDTYEFANELATLPASMTESVAFLDNTFISNAIMDKLEESNKVVFMDDTGDYRIFNAQLGHWNKGNWFSNDAYKTRKTYFGSVAKTKTAGEQVKTQSYYNSVDWDAIDEKAWNDSFKQRNDYYDELEEDWSGFGKSAFKPMEPLWGKPFITDKVYDCGTCQSAVMVDEDACCVTCGGYITDAEGDVVNKMILMD